MVRHKILGSKYIVATWSWKAREIRYKDYFVTPKSLPLLFL